MTARSTFSNLENQPASKTTYSVLCVEDHDDTREMLSELFTLEGYEVKTVATVHEALAELASHHYDIVITDFSLPDGTGHEMIRQAREQGIFPKTPAVLVTAHPNPGPCAETLLLRKPVPVQRLLAVVPELLENDHTRSF